MHVCIGTLLKRAEALGPLLAYGGTQNVCARLNKIKRRQLFWPVAPIMLLEEADQWVDSVAKLHSPCMSFAPKLRQGHAVLPDLAHIDGTLQNTDLLAAAATMATRHAASSQATLF